MPIDQRLPIRAVTSYWRSVHQEAYRAAAKMLGLDSVLRVMIGAIVIAAVLIGLVFWGSADASHDEAIARLVAIGIVIAFFPFVYLWQMVAIPAKRDAKVAERRTIPISITAIDDPTYRRDGLNVQRPNPNGGEKLVEYVTPRLATNEIFISNISTTHAVTLRIFLAITDGEGKIHKHHGDGQDYWGNVLGRNDLVTRLAKKHGLTPPNYIISPIHIPPQASVRGSLQFVLGSFDPEDEIEGKIFEYYVMGMVNRQSDNRFRYVLEIENVMHPGAIIQIPLPSDGYAGEA